MLPIKDTVRSSRPPILVVSIILANIAAFIWELGLGKDLPPALYVFGIVPGRYTNAAVASLFEGTNPLLPFLTTMFLHGGWMHLISNMWALWIFGDNIEDRLGRTRFLALYLGSGLAASTLHIIANSNSLVPAIGASGALAGIMGAYFRLYPTAGIVVAFPPFLWGPYFVLPAMLYLGFWFLMQLFSGAASLGFGGGHAGGVAWWAHIGGFAFGIFWGGRARRLSGHNAPDRVNGLKGY